MSPLWAQNAFGAHPVLLLAVVGLVLGMRHSTDPDHVVAVSTIVSRQRGLRNAALVGALWGLGHTLTIFAVGTLIILFGVVIPPRLGLSMEFAVALMLILLGVLNLTGVMQRFTQRFFPHTHIAEDNPEGPRTLNRFHAFRPLVIGLVHGLAGSAAVALLVLSTIRSPVWASLYLLIFGAGTMLGMILMTVAMALPLAFAGDKFSRLSHILAIASGFVSVAFGTFLVYQLGYVGGLFSSHPRWTPQ